MECEERVVQGGGVVWERAVWGEGASERMRARWSEQEGWRDSEAGQWCVEGEVGVWRERWVCGGRDG